MAEKSILSQLHPRPSFDNSSVEITIIEPHVRGLQSASSNSHSKHHHHHHRKRSEQKKCEIREDLQRKMREVKQKINELEAHGYQESVCHSISKRHHDNLKRSTVTGYSSVIVKTLSRSLSEGALQRKRNKTDSQKSCPSRKSIMCQNCNVRLSQQEELLRFVSAQHQQVLHMMHEIKAELQLIKNDKVLEQFYKKKAESLTALQNNVEVIAASFPAIEQTKRQLQQDTGFPESIKQICGAQNEDTSKDSNTCRTQTKETENSVTISKVTTATAEEQHGNQLPTVKTKLIHEDPKKKENVECVDRMKDTSQKNLKKQNTNLSNQYNTDSDAKSTCSAKHTTKETNVKSSIPQQSVSKDTRTPLRQRKLNSKSFSPETADKIKILPQRETLAPLNRSTAIKQANKSTVQQKTATSAWGTSRSYVSKDGESPKDSQNRQIKPLKLLKAYTPRQTQNKDKDDISNPASTKEDCKPSGNQVNIDTTSSPKVDNNENDSHCSSAVLTNESDSSPASQICFKSSTVTNSVMETNIDEEKEAQCGYQDTSTSTELEITEITSKNASRKHKLGKLLKTRKGAFFGNSGTSTLFKKPPALKRESLSSLTFVIEKSKSKTAVTDQEDKVIPETAAPENYTLFGFNDTDIKKTRPICTSQYVHSTSYTTPVLSFGGKCNIHMIPDTAAVQAVSSAGRNLGRVLTKKSISYDKTSSGQSHSSSERMPSTMAFYSKEQRKNEYKLSETHPRSQTPDMGKLQKVPQHTLVFWDGERFVVGEEARRHMDALTCSCLHQDKKENLSKMVDVPDTAKPEVRTAAAEKGPLWEYNTRNISRNYMQERYVNPNFNSIPTSEANITPRYVTLGPKSKAGPNLSTTLEPMGSDVDMQEIELSLSFDDLEYLLLHKIKKQEQKHNLAQVEALRRTLNAVRQCFKAQQEFIQDSAESLESPKQTLSRIKTVILSPRNFVNGQNVRMCTV